MLQDARLHAASIALALAGVDAGVQSRVLDMLPHRLDNEAAIRRRDYWLRQALNLIGHAPGSVRILAEALQSYSASHWPAHRHLAEPPQGATPLRACLFHVCAASADAGRDVPGYRQVRRIVT